MPNSNDTMKTLYDEIEAIAARQGVRAESGYAADLNGMKRTYPMLLWIPPDPLKFEGRTVPLRITYRCRFYLLEKNDGKASSAERERRWAEMELTAYAAVLALGETEAVEAVGRARPAPADAGRRAVGQNGVYMPIYRVR